MISIAGVVEDIYNNVEINLANSEASSEISKISHEEINSKIVGPKITKITKKYLN